MRFDLSCPEPGHHNAVKGAFVEVLEDALNYRGFKFQVKPYTLQSTVGAVVERYLGFL